MTALLLAFAVWLILRAIDRSTSEPAGPCRICWAPTHWDGKHFVHADGQQYWPYNAPIWNDPLDHGKGEFLHPAIPVDR